jgi:hypothetical protein
MTPMMTSLKRVQDQYFTLVERVEEPVVDATERVAETVARYVPARPAFMAEMPTFKELVENQLKFRKRFVDEQAVFVRRLVKAMDPVLVKAEHVPVKKTAERATAPKASPRMAPRSVAHKAA